MGSTVWTSPEGLMGVGTELTVSAVGLPDKVMLQLHREHQTLVLVETKLQRLAVGPVVAAAQGALKVLAS
jgi:hypothetical protein